MTVEFEIQDEKVQNLSNNAKYELENLTKRYAEEILNEALRIEEIRRNPGTQSEITATILREADIFHKGYPLKKTKPWWLKLIQAISFISTMITGNLLEIEKFKEVDHVIWFIIFLFISVSTTVFLTFNNETNG